MTIVTSNVMKWVSFQTQLHDLLESSQKHFSGIIHGHEFFAPEGKVKKKTIRHNVVNLYKRFEFSKTKPCRTPSLVWLFLDVPATGHSANSASSARRSTQPSASAFLTTPVWMFLWVTIRIFFALAEILWLTLTFCLFLFFCCVFQFGSGYHHT